jgi:hypothetical protein
METQINLCLTKKNIMMRSIKKKLLHSMVLFLAIAGTWSCTTMDEGYKDYIKDGEISYTGKIDSLTVLSGRNRVQVKGLFISDPKITECRVFWNNRKDSLVVPVARTQGVDVLDVMIEGLVENVHNFEVRTYDKLGNKSIPVYKIGTAYGERYQLSLINRPIASSNVTRRDLTINFGTMDFTSGVYGSEVTFTDNSNVKNTVFVPVTSASVVLQDYKMYSAYTYRTLFKPDDSCIDVFYSRVSSVTPVGQYLINNLTPFTKSAYDGARWGTPADWSINAGGLSHLVLGVNYGGVDATAFSFEGGWGQPNITNGKAYQTMTLPAGTYTYTVNINAINYDLTASDKGYYVVAKGNNLPDVTAVESSLSTLKWERANKANMGSRTLTFTLAQSTEVSVGVATTTTGGTASAGRQLKINYFTLIKN